MPGSFFTEDAKTKIALAVQDVESKSSAEIVVSVRARSDDYREVDLAFGLVVSVTTLALLMYHPAELDADLMPVETLLAFVIGSIVANKVAPLKRLLLSKKRRIGRPLVEARALFVEQGISCTRDRSGILVFVSELEKRVVIVADVGIDTDKLGLAWKERVATLESAANARDIAGFAAALRAFGPVLGAAYPRREDDVNELPDSPIMDKVRR